MSQVIGTSPLGQMATPTAGFSVVRSRPGRNRREGNNKLNLVSLMDIFTILVFFLMLNSGDVEVLQPDENIALPQSSATLKPDDVPVIKITPEQILFRDVLVARLDEIGEGDSIVALEKALKDYSAQEQGGTAQSAQGVSIMSDSAASYALLKRVLYASAQAGYRDVGLATEFGQRTTDEAMMAGGR